MQDLTSLFDSLSALIPAKYKPVLMLIAVALPYVTRGLYAFANGGTLRDALHAVLFGTNTPSANPPSGTGNSAGGGVKFPLLIIGGMLVLAFGLIGCGTAARLEAGGSYAVTTNSVTGTTNAAQPELLAADMAYKTAYDLVHGSLQFELDNRETLKTLAPGIKPALDKIRPTAWKVEQTWAAARKAYKANPTPANLTALQSILPEIQQLVPVAEAVAAQIAQLK